MIMSLVLSDHQFNKQAFKTIYNECCIKEAPVHISKYPLYFVSQKLSNIH